MGVCGVKGEVLAFAVRTTPTPTLPQGRASYYAATRAKLLSWQNKKHHRQASFSARTTHRVPPFLPPLREGVLLHGNPTEALIV